MVHETDSTMTESQSPSSSEPSEYGDSPTDAEHASLHTITERTSDGTTDSDAAADVDDGTDRCETCGTTIGPTEYRLSWIVDDGATTLAAHYCSEACFPDERDERPGARSDSSDRTNGPQDWSYCR